MSTLKQLGCVVLVLSLAWACGPSEEEITAAARVEEWAALQADHQDLSTKRDELRALREKITAGPEALAEALEETIAEPSEGSPEEGDSAESSLTPEEAFAQLEEEAAEVERGVNQAADAFGQRLVDFINEFAGYEGDEPYPEVKAALRMKSGEDVVLAREYIEKGGDYGKAVDIMESALAVDPENEELARELEEVKALRYMDEERFSKVEKGMNESEVREVLGQVKHQNVREYEDRDVVAWFYPREGGAAAAVFFRERKGQLRVYDMNFEAVKTAAERAMEEEEE